MGRKQKLKQERREREQATEQRDKQARSYGPPGRVSALPSRRSLLILLVILAVGLGLRLAYLGELQGEPDYSFPLVDGHYHDYWARAAASGDWSPPRFEPDPQIATTPYFRPPGYPIFLAAVYRLLGDDYTTPRVVQMILGLVGVLLVFQLGRRVFNEKTGLVAAGLAAVYWAFIYYEGEFLEPSLSVLLILAVPLRLLAWRDRPTAMRALTAGLFLGALALLRPNALLLAPVAAGWFWWAGRGQPARLAFWRPSVLLTVGVMIAILPVTVRNYRVSGESVLISTNSGINLLIGHHERADGQVRGTLPGIGSLDTCFDWPAIVRRVAQIEGRRLSHTEVSDFLTERALEHIRQDPVRALGLACRKTLLFWGPGEVADNKVMDLERQHSRILSRIPLTFPVAYALGLLGLVTFLAGRRLGGASGADSTGARLVATVSRPEAVWLLVAVVFVWFASHLPFAVTSRYRVPVIPFLLVFGSFFLVQLGTLIRSRRWPAAALGLSMLVVMLMLTHINRVYEPSVSRWHYQRGIAYLRGGETDAAIAQLEQAITHNPDYVAVYNDLGAALVTQGKMAESVPYFEQAVALNPHQATARANLAAILEYLGRRKESHHHFAEALRLDPSDREAREGFERTRPRSEPD